jgi:hypothetical protein
MIDAMDEDDDGFFENIDELDEAQILSQQFAEYVVSVSRADTPREEKIQNLHRYACSKLLDFHASGPFRKTSFRLLTRKLVWIFRMAHIFEKEETKFRNSGGNVLSDDRDGPFSPLNFSFRFLMLGNFIFVN